MLHEEESKWYQRAKIIKLLKGDCNTRYFQVVASGKHRRTRIFWLDQEEGIIEGDENLKRYITNYYKGIFGKLKNNGFSLLEPMTDDIPQVTPEENDILSTRFTDEEIKEEIFQMEHNKAPRPDGFPAEFYQAFWQTIKGDFMALFNEFQRDLPLFSLNFGIITKVITNRLALVAEKVIRPSQTAFMTGRNIMEGAVILHETIHEMHRNKLDGVVLKIYFEKAYDTGNWIFLQQMLRMKGFSPLWCKWINQIVKGGSVGIRVLFPN